MTITDKPFTINAAILNEKNEIVTFNFTGTLSLVMTNNFKHQIGDPGQRLFLNNQPRDDCFYRPKPTMGEISFFNP